MNPIIVAVVLILGGLGICYLSSKAVSGILSRVFWWGGILVAVLGLILLLFPVLAFIYKNLREALNA